MAYLIPETAKRLQSVMFVSNAELAARGRAEIMRRAAKEVAEGATRKLLEDCIHTEGDDGHWWEISAFSVHCLPYIIDVLQKQKGE